MESRISKSTIITTISVIFLTVAILLSMDDNHTKNITAGISLFVCLVLFTAIVLTRGTTDHSNKNTYDTN